jgi:CheY-specific phosphatase CheX
VASGLNAAAAAKAEGGAPAATLDAAGALAELAGIIAGRLRTALEAEGVRATVAAPEVMDGAAGNLSDGGETGMQVAITTADAGLTFVLQLTSQRVSAEATASSVEPAPEAARAS